VTLVTDPICDCLDVRSLESVQAMLLKLALQLAREDYETRRERQKQGITLAKAEGKYQGRKADTATHERVIELRKLATASPRQPSWLDALWLRPSASGPNSRAARHSEPDHLPLFR
jgi:hypothetical protein